MYMNYAKYTFNSVWYLHSDSTSDEVGSWFDATLAGSRCAIRLMHSVKSVIAQPKTSADQQARKVDTEDRACHAAYDKITHRIKPPVDCFIVHLYLRFIPLLIPPLVRLFTKKGRGWIRFIVDFQPLMVISPTASWIRWCMQMYACEFMWTCLVWAERSTPNSFWVPSHLFNSATGEQRGITQTIYTDSEPPSRLPNSFMPSAKLRSANLPVFTSLVWRGREPNPALPHDERTLY